MTFTSLSTSKECNSTKEDDFEYKLYGEFKALEKEYEGVDRVLEKLEGFYVYKGSINGVVMYVGMGSLDRMLHLNSGTSHVYEANKAHFNGVTVDVYKVKDGLTRTEALTFERQLIEDEQPQWNLTYTDVVKIKRSMQRTLTKYQDLENKSTNLNLLFLALGKVQSDYSFDLNASDFASYTGLRLAGWVANFRSAKNKHKFIDAVQKVKAGVYNLKLNKTFIDKLDMCIHDVRLVNDRE